MFFYELKLIYMLYFQGLKSFLEINVRKIFLVSKIDFWIRKHVFENYGFFCLFSYLVLQENRKLWFCTRSICAFISTKKIRICHKRDLCRATCTFLSPVFISDSQPVHHVNFLVHLFALILVFLFSLLCNHSDILFIHSYDFSTCNKFNV